MEIRRLSPAGDLSSGHVALFLPFWRAQSPSEPQHNSGMTPEASWLLNRGQPVGSFFSNGHGTRGSATVVSTSVDKHYSSNILNT